MRRLFVAISGHGYGHLVQVAPLVNDLCMRSSAAVELTVQSALPRAYIATRIRQPFHLVSEPPDIGMIMQGALQILERETRDAYRGFHRHWSALLTRQRQILEAARADLLIADVPYLPLAAAQLLGIPNVAICSLNWADILDGYWPCEPEVERWTAQMRQIYGAADLFLVPDPAMPMAWLPNRRAIGPTIAPGRRRREEIRRELGMADEQLLALLSLGGIQTDIPLPDWPRDPSIHWLTHQSADSLPSGFHSTQRLQWPFADLIASVDAVVTKPGYGMFAEAACSGIPVLYAQRRRWPEEPFLVAWLQAHGRAEPVDAETLYSGQLGPGLRSLLARPMPAPPKADGARQGAELVWNLLTR